MIRQSEGREVGGCARRSPAAWRGPRGCPRPRPPPPPRAGCLAPVCALATRRSNCRGVRPGQSVVGIASRASSWELARRETPGASWDRIASLHSTRRRPRLRINSAVPCGPLQARLGAVFTGTLPLRPPGTPTDKNERGAGALRSSALVPGTLRASYWVRDADRLQQCCKRSAISLK